MLRIPLTAHAECTDGPCGDLSGLVIRADSRTLEYFVVRDTTPGHPIERLVPRAEIDPAAGSTMRLSCTLAELGKMQPLNVQEVTSGGGSSSGAYGRAGGYNVADSERAPDGTGVLRQDQHVEATDGKIGKLTGVAIDDEARITEFYTRITADRQRCCCLRQRCRTLIARPCICCSISASSSQIRQARQRHSRRTLLRKRSHAPNRGGVSGAAKPAISGRRIWPRRRRQPRSWR